MSESALRSPHFNDSFEVFTLFLLDDTLCKRVDFMSNSLLHWNFPVQPQLREDQSDVPRHADLDLQDSTPRGLEAGGEAGEELGDAPNVQSEAPRGGGSLRKPLCTCTTGWTRLRSAPLGSARLRSAPLGSARLRSARFGSARLRSAVFWFPFTNVCGQYARR
ncbi:hypothetical protein EYF80_046532 [Liparis tanakae]|uniref:Uncharacterized protein n=1 Tax=Liparis tanakae TaxID=230148 RepID=A0A4Z2FSB1_9TELE|nr:hypothetical protein EYF80_046532 [Liparis tanakae]